MRPAIRKVAWIAALVVVVLAATGGIALWRWHTWITTPPLRLVARGDVPTIDGERMAAEWEPVAGALIAWPFHLPRELIVALASDVHL